MPVVALYNYKYKFNEKSDKTLNQAMLPESHQRGGQWSDVVSIPVAG